VPDHNGAFVQPLKQRDSAFRFPVNGCGGGERLQFAGGQVVHASNTRANLFYVVESGEVRLYNWPIHGNAHLLDILGPGDWFGGAAVARIPQYECRALSVGNSTIWACPADEVRKYLAEHGDVALQFIESAMWKLHQSWASAGGMAFDDCRSRLVKTLLRFSESAAAKKTPEGVVLKITHAQLAQAVGAARETVSICLTELREKQIVRTGRNQLFFDPKRLKEADHKSGSPGGLNESN
jgi:CRP-like cAMP-binding protein